MTEQQPSSVFIDLTVDPPKTVFVFTPRKEVRVEYIPEEEIAKVVDKLPVFPGGNDAFRIFIDDLSREMVPLLLEGQEKTYVMLEFIIDKDGKPVNAKVLRGGNDDINERLEEKFDTMDAWTPAIRTDKNVAIRLKQSIAIERPTAKN